MTHFAKIENGVVTQVIVVEHDVISSGAFGDPASWVQTSYGTRGGVHYGSDGLPDGGVALRKNYAGVGFTYDSVRDAFIPPKPFNSWVLSEDTCHWLPPVPAPASTDGEAYHWDEKSQSWSN